METSVDGSKLQANIFVDTLASLLAQLGEVKTGTLISAMENRLKHDREQIALLEKQQAEMSAAYNRYLDIHQQIRAHEKSIEKIEGLISPVNQSRVPESNYELEEMERASVLRRNLQLWEAIEQYLRFIPEREARVREILDFLEAVEFDCSRQSVEAAIRAHSKVFRVQKRKNEKYISLKGA